MINILDGHPFKSKYEGEEDKSSHVDELSEILHQKYIQNTLQSVVEFSQSYHLDIVIMWRLLQH